MIPRLPFQFRSSHLARRLGDQREPRARVLRLLTAVDERDDQEGLAAALFFVLHGVDAQIAIGRVDQQRQVVIVGSTPARCRIGR